MLDDAKIRNAKPATLAYRMADREGLFLDVRPGGTKSWRVRFKVWDAARARVVEKLFTLGRYPKISLAGARRMRDDVMERVQAGADPAAEKKAKKRPPPPPHTVTFEEASKAWHHSQDSGWSVTYSMQTWGRIDRDLLPTLGKIPVASLTRADVLKALRKVEARGAHDVARKCRQHVAGILRHAGAEDERVTDFTPMLRGGLKPPPRVRHYRTLTGDAFGEVVLAVDRYTGDLTTKIGLQLALLTAARTSEVIGASWGEFENLKRPGEALWRIPATRMKAKREHLIPLSRQAVAALDALHKAGGGVRLFPGDRGRGMSNNCMLFALYACGFHSKQTVHGFRRAFSTWGNEAAFNADAIERALAHDRGDVRSIYNAATYLPHRREILQAWADHLDKLKADAEVKALIG